MARKVSRLASLESTLVAISSNDRARIRNACDGFRVVQRLWRRWTRSKVAFAISGTMAMTIAPEPVFGQAAAGDDAQTIQILRSMQQKLDHQNLRLDDLENQNRTLRQSLQQTQPSPSLPSVFSSPP